VQIAVIDRATSNQRSSFLDSPGFHINARYSLHDQAPSDRSQRRNNTTDGDGLAAVAAPGLGQDYRLVLQLG
jgi:hypothetical protein